MSAPDPRSSVDSTGDRRRALSAAARLSWLLWAAVLGAFGMVTVACTSSPSQSASSSSSTAPGSTRTGASTATGATDASSTTAAGGPSSSGASTVTTPPSTVPMQTGPKVPNTNTVPLPPVVPQAAPSGSDDTAKESATKVAACVAQRNCANVVGTKVEWPGADISNMDFSFALLTGVDLRGVNAANTNFAGANLSGANLSGANLSGANLSGADLPGADLTNADLSGANLRGANLTSAIIIGTDFQSAFYCETVMPDGTQRTGQCER